MSKVFTGKGGITAQIIADSISESGQRITTFELVYHRYIHAQVLTHRAFSRNAMSSRAVPVQRMIELILDNPAIPIHWGAKQAGMQADNECSNLIDLPNLSYDYCDQFEITPEEAWLIGRDEAINIAQAYDNAGYHKQIVNRPLEPFQMMKSVVTFTNGDNFFYLRRHKSPQPEIDELGNMMWNSYQDSTPELLQAGEWHTPYVIHLRDEDGLHYVAYETIPESADPVGYYITLEQALKVSSSCCAQVSYRKLDDSLEKALDIYQKLVDDDPVHASAFEHCATPMTEPTQTDKYLWQEGMTHMDRNGDMWSGNFRHWIQYRQLIPNNVCNNYNG